MIEEPDQTAAMPGAIDQAKAWVERIGPNNPVMLEIEPIAPCKRPCSVASTFAVIIDCRAGPATLAKAR